MNSGSIPGYFLQAIPVTVVVGTLYILLRSVFLTRKKARITWLSEIIRLLFVCYLTGLCSLVILPANFWLSFFDGIFFGWWDNMGTFFRLGEINLIPAVVKCINGEVTLGTWAKEMLVGNIVMFMPFGFLLPYITEKPNKKNFFAIAVTVPLIVELLQLVIGRSFDIDDLICNFLGIITGFLLAFGIKRLGRAFVKSK